MKTTASSLKDDANRRILALALHAL